MILNNFVHTVATPRKKTGREAPSSFLPRGVISTKEPSPVSSELGGSVGYIVLTLGWKTAAILPPTSLTKSCPILTLDVLGECFCASSLSSSLSCAMSDSQVRG